MSSGRSDRVLARRLVQLGAAAIVVIWGALRAATSSSRIAERAASLKDAAETYVGGAVAKPVTELALEIDTRQGFRGIALVWLAASLILLWAKLDLQRLRWRGIVPELISVFAAWQGLAQTRSPEVLEPLAVRFERVLAPVDVKLGLFAWVALAALACARTLTPRRPATPWWVLAAPALVVVPLSSVATGMLLGTAVLAAAALAARGLRRPTDDAEADACISYLALGAGALLGVVLGGSTAPAPRTFLGAVLAAGLLVASLELASLRRTLRAGAHDDGTDTAAAMIDGRPVLSPFVIPNEARIRVIVALAFGLLAYAYHAQLMAAVAANAALSATTAAVVVNAGLTFALVAAPGLWVLSASRPSGTPIARYEPGSALSALPCSEPAQFYDALLLSELSAIVDAWRPARSFTVHRTRGVGTPGAGWGPDGYFIEFPAGTLHRFFPPGSEPTPEARALLAHEVSHVVHRDPAPLAFATAYCAAAAVIWPISGALLGLSSVSPGSTLMPPARFDVWLLMAVIAVASYAILLRAAQRKIELLADARAALHLGSLGPVRQMVETLLSLGAPPEQQESRVLTPLRLGAASTLPSPGNSNILQRILRAVDTHEPLARRLQYLQGGLHAIGAPDATTIFAVSALAWLPLAWLPGALSERIVEPSWSPLLLKTIVGLLGLGVMFLEYYFLAALVVSPRGGRGDAASAWKLRFAYLGGAAAGAVFWVLFGLPAFLRGFPELSELSQMLGTGAMMEDGEALPDAGLAKVLGAVMLGGLGVVLAVSFTVYLVTRALFILLLQRLGRALLVSVPRIGATAAILAPFLCAAAAWQLLPPVVGLFAFDLFPSLMKLGADTFASKSPLPFIAGGLALSVLAVSAAIALVVGAFALRARARRCCEHARIGDDWVVNALYRGCPACGRAPAESLTRWRIRDASSRQRWTEFRATPIFGVALVLVGALAWAAPTFPEDWVDDAAPETVRGALDDPERRAAVEDVAARADLVFQASSSPLSERIFGVMLMNAPNATELAPMRMKYVSTVRATETSPEGRLLRKFLEMNPRDGRDEVSVSARLTGRAGWPLVLGALWGVAKGTADPSEIGKLGGALGAPCASPTRSLAEHERLLLALCHLHRLEAKQALELLDGYHGGAVRFGEIGVVRGMAAILTGDGSRALDEAARYQRLCARAPEACPRATPVVLREIVTLATARELASREPADTSELEAELAERGHDDHALAVRWFVAQQAMQGDAGAKAHLSLLGVSIEDVESARDRALATEAFAQSPRVPLRGEPHAFDKPVTLLTEFLPEQAKAAAGAPAITDEDVGGQDETP